MTGAGDPGGGASSGAEIGPGVRAVEHTADVGIDVRAPGLEELFRRAAQGLAALLYEGEAEDSGAPVERALELEADDPARLLLLWLRELLFLHEVDGLVIRDAPALEVDGLRLRATARLSSTASRPAREIKGVTYHGLEARRREDGSWQARVIFDV